MKNLMFYRGFITLMLILATGKVCSAASVPATASLFPEVDPRTFLVLAADDHADDHVDLIPDPFAPRYPGKIGKGLHPPNGGIGSVPTGVGGGQLYKTEKDHHQKGPALKSTNRKECAKSVQAHITLDLSSLNTKEISTVQGEKTVTLPLVGSAPFLDKAIQCRYGSGNISMSYLIQCLQPTKSNVPNAYYCRKIHLLLQTPPVPAPPVRR